MMQIFCTQYDVFRVGLWHEVSVDPDGVFVSLFLGSVWGPTPSSNTAVLLGAPVQSRRRLDNTSGGEGRHATVAPLMIIVQPNVVVRGSQPFSASSRGGGERQVERTLLL